MFTRKPWRYGSEVKNREYLQQGEPFESMVHELSSALSHVDQSAVRFHIEPKNENYDDRLLKRLKCKRAVWHIELDSVLLDKFFNGLMGIRAQYYKDPYHGHCMNQLVLSALHNRLLELALASHKPSPPRELVKLSLSKPSAKVWISEKNLAGEKIIRVSDCTLAEEQLQNDWLDIARAVKKGKFCGEYYDIYCAAFQGVRVPVADQLEIKGAWISHDDRCEYVTPGKQDRHVQLFMFGFS